MTTGGLADDMARPSLLSGALRVRFELRLTDAEKADLFAVAKELGHPSACDFAREAINEAVSDFRERRMFERRQVNRPVAVERRKTDRRAEG
jgi:hypothetical protein